MENKKKPTYKDVNGTTRVGDALRWLGKQGKEFAPELLNMAGAVTGIESLKVLGNAIKGDEGLSDLDKQMLLQELELDMVREEEITKRWEADLHSDSWMSKNIRPATLTFLLICMFIFIMLDSFFVGFDMNPAWITLLQGLLMTAVGGYFVVRSGEKIMNKWRDNK